MLLRIHTCVPLLHVVLTYIIQRYWYMVGTWGTYIIQICHFLDVVCLNVWEVYVCIYVCMYECTYVCTYVCMYVCKYLHMYTVYCKMFATNNFREFRE